jgi:hypothetical protein
MNLSKELFETLLGWFSCVEKLPNESDLEWVKRAMTMRLDLDIVLVEIPRQEFDESCKKIVDEFLDKLGIYYEKK